MENWKVDSLVLGMLRTNCYLLTNTETGETLIIDPAAGSERIAGKLLEEGRKPVAVLLTHGHFDHMGAADSVRRRWKIPVYLGKDEDDVAQDPMKNLSGIWGSSLTLTADKLLEDGSVLSLAGFEIRVIRTPGHTKGSVCYYLPEQKLLFSGDTLFRESVGRSDFPTGSGGALSRSVKLLLAGIPEETRVYPGHEGETDIAHEKHYNPFA